MNISTLAFLKDCLQIDPQGRVSIQDKKKLQEETIDQLIDLAVFGKAEQQALACWLIWELGQALGIYPASIHEFYKAVGRGEIGRSLTVPAINLRAMTFDCARAAFRAAVQRKVGAVIFEI